MSQTDVFVLDDEMVIAQTLGIILRQAGYKVEVFTDPHVALMSLNSPPRLLLSDQTMPGLSGCAVAALFLQACRSIAVLMFSANLSECDLEWQYVHRQARQSDLLRKPLHPTALLKSVEAAIGVPVSFLKSCTHQFPHRDNSDEASMLRSSPVTI